MFIGYKIVKHYIYKTSTEFWLSSLEGTSGSTSGKAAETHRLPQTSKIRSQRKKLQALWVRTE
jgi:hypothetical protein